MTNAQSTKPTKEVAVFGAGLVGLGRKKSLTSQMSKRRLAEQAKADVQESVDAIAQFEKEIQILQQELQAATDEINARWGELVNDTSEVTVTPKKTDIFVELFGIAWTPYYLVESGGGLVELPAFGQEG